MQRRQGSRLNGESADHFEWNGPLLVGKTPVGSVTIDVLAINLPYRVTLRTALFEEGIFPLDDE
jgi:hypothetical protein